MDQLDLAPVQVRAHLPNMCKDSGHWAFRHQYGCKLDARTHLQDSAETHPGTPLVLEVLQEQHLGAVLVQAVQEVHPYIHKGRQY